MLKTSLVITFAACTFLSQTIDGQNTDWGLRYCRRDSSQVTEWDSCLLTTPGQFKSVSVCYQRSDTRDYVYRYDFYTCINAGNIVYLMPANCSGPLSPIIRPDGTYTVFNRYNPTTKTCNLVPPPPPPPPPPPVTEDPVTSNPRDGAPEEWDWDW